MCLNYLYRCEKQGKTPQKDAKINPEIRRKKVSKTGKDWTQKRSRKSQKLDDGPKIWKILIKLMRFN